MKKLHSFIVVLILASTYALTMDWRSATLYGWQESNKCAACIIGGNTFCFQHKENLTLGEDDVYPNYKCCEGTRNPRVSTTNTDNWCPESRNSRYQCSSEFNQTAYALLTCPHETAKCGFRQVFQLNRVNSDDTVTMKNLRSGDSCTYEVEANCGGPAFEVSQTSQIQSDQIGIAYLEYNGRKYNQWRNIPVTYDQYNINITRRYNETYIEGMPARNQSFVQSLRQEGYSQQQLPRRIRDDLTWTIQKNLGYTYSREYDSNGNEILPNPDFGKAVMGYGVATQGDYDMYGKGWKTFGSVGQGTVLQAVKEDGSNDCENRQIYVTVYAVYDFKDEDYVTLKFGSWQFDTPSSGSVTSNTNTNSNANSVTGNGTYNSGYRRASGISLKLSLIFVLTSMLLTFS